MRQETENPLLQVNDPDLAKRLNMKPGHFYCYYKPSYINGYEQYLEKDIDFSYLQAIEGVCRDEFVLNEQYVRSLEFQDLLKGRRMGFQTEEFAEEVFDECFSRSYSVEFVLNPNLKEFKRKFLKGKGASKPMLFIYCPPLYMSRYIGEFKEVLKNY